MSGYDETKSKMVIIDKCQLRLEPARCLWFWVAFLRASSKPHLLLAGPKQTQLAKAGLGKQGNFLPAVLAGREEALGGRTWEESRWKSHRIFKERETQNKLSTLDQRPELAYWQTRRGGGYLVQSCRFLLGVELDFSRESNHPPFMSSCSPFSQNANGERTCKAPGLEVGGYLGLRKHWSDRRWRSSSGYKSSHGTQILET